MPQLKEIILTGEEVETALKEYLLKYNLLPDWNKKNTMYVLDWCGYNRQVVNSLILKFVEE